MKWELRQGLSLGAASWKRGMHIAAMTALVFVVSGILYYLPSTLVVLDPIAQTLGDIELSDLVFSRLRDETSVTADTNIVIVNIGKLDRFGIARLVSRVADAKPRVIGVDAIFRLPKSPEGDAALAEALQRYPRTIMVSKLADYSDSLSAFMRKESSHESFKTPAGTGFVNMLANSDDDMDDAKPTDMIREFSAVEKLRLQDSIGTINTSLNPNEEWAFAVKVAWYFDSNAVKRLFARREGTEVINYRGNTDKFFCIDTDLPDSTDLSFVRDKIVFFGFLGERIGQPSTEDIFFTPLNKRYTGRTFPDMFGVVIHANIASMILSGSYITVLPTALDYLLAALICIGNLGILTYFYEKHPKWYDVASLFMQALQSISLLVIFTLAFHWFRLKLNATMYVAIVVLTPLVQQYYYLAFRRFLSSNEATSGDS